jgi:glycosyltransferase involved in cell wall biosynthesis
VVHKLKSGYQYTFTVFTATYNRAHTINRVYESLKSQSFLDFEWLIIDDGSSDGTYELIQHWQTQAPFPIRYAWQENQGKHIAFNRGVKEAKGELFLQLDSDDSCIPEALERFKSHWDAIPVGEQALFSAVTALCMNERGGLIGDKFPLDVLDSDSMEIRYRYKVKGDKWGFHRTEVLQNFPFPDSYRGLVPEGVVWSAIASKYKTRFINEMLHVYWSDENADSDQLTKESNPFKYAAGLALWHQSILNHDIVWLRFAPEQFLRSAVHYVRFSSHMGKNIFEQVRNLNNLAARTLWAIALPFGLLIHSMEGGSTKENRFIGKNSLDQQ